METCGKDTDSALSLVSFAAASGLAGLIWAHFTVMTISLAAESQVECLHRSDQLRQSTHFNHRGKKRKTPNMSSWVRANSKEARQEEGRPYQVSKGIGVVKAGVAGGRYHVCQVVGRQAEVGYMLKVTVTVLQMNPIVLHTNRGNRDFPEVLRNSGETVPYCSTQRQWLTCNFAQPSPHCPASNV